MSRVRPRVAPQPRCRQLAAAAIPKARDRPPHLELLGETHVATTARDDGRLPGITRSPHSNQERRAMLRNRSGTPIEFGEAGAATGRPRARGGGPSSADASSPRRSSTWPHSGLPGGHSGPSVAAAATIASAVEGLSRRLPDRRLGRRGRVDPGARRLPKASVQGWGLRRPRQRLRDQATPKRPRPSGRATEEKSEEKAGIHNEAWGAFRTIHSREGQRASRPPAR